MGSIETVQAGDATARLYVAQNDRGDGPGMVLLHAWWGLNDDVIAFADRLAGEGFTVAAPDMFGGQLATTVDEADRLSSSSDDATVGAIVLAAIDRLGDRLDPSTKLAALGFSFGAAWAIWAPTQRDRVAATVVYYGTWVGSVLGKSTVPVLGHFAEDDPYETAETVDQFEQGLRDAGRETTIYRYPGTGHWFAEPSRDACRPADAEIAFGRTIAFLRAQLQLQGPAR